MTLTKQIAQPVRYASGDDFRKIFDEEMNSLYLLSFLLTADPALAEQGFVSGLRDAVKSNRVFKDWARSWAERMIIQNAVRALKPKPMPVDEGARTVAVDRGEQSGQPEAFAAILELDTFTRFVYVITVLQSYSDQDCSVLLGCARRDVLSARVRALQQIGTATTANRSSAEAAAKTTLRDLAGSALGWLRTFHLVASA